MEPTRRCWALVALGITSAVFAILFGEVLWLGIPVGIATWILGDQIAFTTVLREATQSPPIHQTLQRDTVLVDDATTLEIQLTSPIDHLVALDAALTVTSHPAITIEDSGPHELTTKAATIAVPVSVDVAGTYRIQRPTVQTTSHRGLFRETLQIGNECSVTGEPRVPRDIHIGTGGERIAVGDGEHDATQGSGGFDPGELREYLPGDPTNRIDWNATARLGEPYIREIEAESTRQSHLILDRRSPMEVGPAGLTKLDHAREVAIWLAEYVASMTDPLALTVVDEDEITGSTATESTTAHYQRIRRELLSLATDTPPAERDTPRATRGATRSSRQARVRAEALTDDSKYARTLRPYFHHVDAYVERVTEDPLFQSVQSRLADQRGDSWLAIITDDTNRAELLETTRLAASTDTHVSVFVLPSVLFDDQAFTDLEEAYAEYRDFEEFRQQLAATANCSAFEVGPRDRLASLLDAGPAQTQIQP